jgi:hypothetical protein
LCVESRNFRDSGDASGSKGFIGFCRSRKKASPMLTSDLKKSVRAG